MSRRIEERAPATRSLIEIRPPGWVVGSLATGLERWVKGFSNEQKTLTIRIASNQAATRLKVAGNIGREGALGMKIDV